MSWAVPLPVGGWRLYSKGASEIILARCVSILGEDGNCTPLSEAEKQKLTKSVINKFASEAMRTIGLAYRDFPDTPNWDEEHSMIQNSNGTPARAAETELILVGIVGIEDPLRPEVILHAHVCCLCTGFLHSPHISSGLCLRLNSVRSGASMLSTQARLLIASRAPDCLSLGYDLV